MFGGQKIILVFCIACVEDKKLTHGPVREKKNPIFVQSLVSQLVQYQEQF
jgi:hypothetical protein